MFAEDVAELKQPGRASEAVARNARTARKIALFGRRLFTRRRHLLLPLPPLSVTDGPDIRRTRVHQSIDPAPRDGENAARVLEENLHSSCTMP